jgi:hypothetical protein
MTLVSRSLGGAIVLWAGVVIAWCVLVALTDDNWGTRVEPVYVLLVALVAVASGAFGVVGLQRGAFRPIAIGLALAARVSTSTSAARPSSGERTFDSTSIAAIVPRPKPIVALLQTRDCSTPPVRRREAMGHRQSN